MRPTFQNWVTDFKEKSPITYNGMSQTQLLEKYHEIHGTEEEIVEQYVASVNIIQKAIEDSTEYLEIKSVVQIEELYQSLLLSPIEILRPVEKELLVLMPKVVGRKEYIEAKQNLLRINLQKELISMFSKATKIKPNAKNVNGIMPILGASAILANQKLSSMAEDVEGISEGLGLD